jgi:hypothetical protein
MDQFTPPYKFAQAGLMGASELQLKKLDYACAEKSGNRRAI